MNQCNLQRRATAWMLVTTGCLLASMLSAAVESATEQGVLRVCPVNPRYFLWQGRPTVLVASGEHYGAVMNEDLDFRKYLAAVEAVGLNHTRIFLGDYVEIAGAFGIIDGTTEFDSKHYLSLDNGNILGRQEAYCRKIVREMNPYGNLFFNLCNEPWFYNQEKPGFASQPPVAVKAWYKPPHGGGIHQTRESVIKGSGHFSLKVECSTTQSDDKFYSPICRVSKWNLGSCNALQFWFKPDGSGRALLVDLNIANSERKNIHDLWDFTYLPKKGDTSPRIVTVPFSKLVKNAKYADSPNTSPMFKPEALIEVALCIGGRNDEAGVGVYYFDDFRGVFVK